MQLSVRLAITALALAACDLQPPPPAVATTKDETPPAAAAPPAAVAPAVAPVVPLEPIKVAPPTLPAAPTLSWGSGAYTTAGFPATAADGTAVLYAVADTGLTLVTLDLHGKVLDTLVLPPPTASPPSPADVKKATDALTASQAKYGWKPVELHHLALRAGGGGDGDHANVAGFDVAIASGDEGKITLSNGGVVLASALDLGADLETGARAKPHNDHPCSASPHLTGIGFDVVHSIAVVEIGIVSGDGCAFGPVQAAHSFAPVPQITWQSTGDAESRFTLKNLPAIAADGRTLLFAVTDSTETVDTGLTVLETDVHNVVGDKLTLPAFVTTAGQSAPSAAALKSLDAFLATSQAKHAWKPLNVRPVAHDGRTTIDGIDLDKTNTPTSHLVRLTQAGTVVADKIDLDQDVKQLAHGRRVAGCGGEPNVAAMAVDQLHSLVVLVITQPPHDTCVPAPIYAVHSWK